MSAADLARQLGERAEDVCRYLLPNGRRVGHEWKAGDVYGASGDSLGVRLAGDKGGLWQDFGGPEDHRGDLIRLWVLARGVDVATACVEAEDFLGIERRTNGHARPIVRAAAPSAEPSHINPRLGTPSAVWAYRDSAGGLLGYVCRFDRDGQRKEVLPQTWDGTAWAWKGFSDPRPLYGLERLAARPDAPVLVVEGEKCADAATAVLGGMVAVSWQGGAQAITKADLEPLRGRVLTLWPDADDAGKAAMLALADRLGQPCRIVRPNGQTEGWDIADAIAEGWDAEAVKMWAKAHVEEWFPEPEPDPIEETHERVSDYTPHHPDLIEEEWPEPMDIFTRMPTPELRPEHLPPEVSEFIFDQSEIIGSDPGTLALAVLAACAACTHDSIKIRPKRHDRWTEEARLWCGIVGDPGVKKTPPIKRAMAHLRKIEIDWHAEDRLALPKFEIEKKRFIKLEAMAVNDPSLPIPEPPRKPPNRQLIAQDTTIEALSVALTDNVGGMLVFHDELSGFFGSMDAYRSNSGKDRSFWLDAYGGGPRNINRIGRESIPVPNLSVCILGGMQPEPMRKISAKLDDDGLLQRFVLVMAKEPSQGPQDREENRKAAYGYSCMLDYLVTMRGGDDPVRMSEEALQIREKIDEKVRRLASTDMLHARLRSHLRKWEGLFPRLCLTYHAIHCANAAIHVHEPVSGDTAARVGLFLFDYLLGHLRAFYDDVLGESGSISHAQWIAGHLLAHIPEVLTNRDLYRVYRPWRGMSHPEKLSTMGDLEMSGWVRQTSTIRRGWKDIRWEVNPNLAERFAEKREFEIKARQSAIRSVIRNSKPQLNDM